MHNCLCIHSEILTFHKQIGTVFKFQQGHMFSTIEPELRQVSDVQKVMVAQKNTSGIDLKT